MSSEGSTADGLFERQARALLEDSVTSIDARVRSRLNQARHAAVEEATRSPRPLWGRFALMPAAGAVAAALLVAFVLWPHSRQPELPVATHPNVEDMDLLADSDALELVSEGSDGAFYEWAVDQTQPEVPSESSS